MKLLRISDLLFRGQLLLLYVEGEGDQEGQPGVDVGPELAVLPVAAHRHL